MKRRVVLLAALSLAILPQSQPSWSAPPCLGRSDTDCSGSAMSPHAGRSIGTHARDMTTPSPVGDGVPASATVEFFTNRSLWTAAAGPNWTLDFNDFTQDTYFSQTPLDAGPFTLSESGPGAYGLIDVYPWINADPVASNSPHALIFVDGATSPPTTATLVFRTSVTSFGGDFQYPGNVGPLILSLTTSAGVVSGEVNAPTGLTFFGFVSTSFVSAITFTNIANDGFFIDDAAGAFATSTHVITASAGPNGTIQPSGSIPVATGASQSFTISPNPGYRIDDVVVDGGSVGSLPSYTFNDVISNHTIAASFVSATGSSYVHIDFDRTPAGAPIANGTVVNHVYAPWGVTFIADHCSICGSDPNVYANSNCLTGGPISAPNVVTLFGSSTCSDISEDYLGLVRATFNTSADFVSIRTKPVRATDFAVLHAFNIAGIEIATSRSSPGVTQDLSVSASGIESVTFSGSGENFAWFDDLIVRFGSPSYTITANAEPGGSISPSGAVTVAAGASPTFSITPDPSHRVRDVLVDEASVGPVTSYTFTNVLADHSIAARFDYCWPYEISRVEFTGFDRKSAPDASTFPVGFKFENLRAFEIDERDASCWHVPNTGPITLGGCVQQMIRVDFNPDGACDVTKLPLSITDYFTGERIVETSHIVIADHPLLSQDDLVVPNWRNFGGLVGLVRAYAPVFKFNAGENFLPVRPEVNLHRASLRTDGPGRPTPDPPAFDKSELTPEDLAEYSWSFLTIDEPCPSGDADCALTTYMEALSATPTPRFRIYATAIRDPSAKTSASGDDAIVVQYWMNYYYNDFTMCGGRKDWHEGDWEHVSIAFDVDLRPRAMRFASHFPESREWNDVEKWNGGRRPVVYVSQGAHGNFARAGVEPLLCEHHEGDGAVFAPNDDQLEIVPRWSRLDDPRTGNRWIKFAGYWGTESAGYHDDQSPPIDGSTSPVKGPAWRGPAFRKAWLHPLREDFKKVTVVAQGPVDIAVADPMGRVCDRNRTEIPLASYQTLFDGDGDSERWVQVEIPDAAAGSYHVYVVASAQPGAVAAGTGEVSVRVRSDWLGKPTETIVLADRIPVSSVPQKGYELIPPVPRIGDSEVFPSVWTIGGTTDTAVVEWRLTAGDESFDVTTLAPESLRLNGTVAPILPVTVQGSTMILRFPRDAALLSISDPMAGTSQRVTLTGRFADQVTLEASAIVAIDVITSTTLLRFEADVTREGVRLQWQFHVSPPASRTSIERATHSAGPWTSLAVETRTVGELCEALDRTTLPGATYYYRLIAEFSDGTRSTFGPVVATSLQDVYVSGITGIVPNPMSGSTRIDFALAREERVRVSVVDVTGREAAILSEGRMLPGRYSLLWDGGAPSRLTAGIYYIHWKSDSRRMTMRLVIVR